jgi:hypothetical protein
MKPKTFEDCLQEFHAESYHGTDDNMPDAFDAWLVELDADSWIALGDRALETERLGCYEAHQNEI